MKPIPQQASVFGVSAIDLFASALGAFIVVSLVLLPYFPNTGRTPNTAPEPPATPATATDLTRDSTDDLRNRLAQAETRANELAQALDDARSQLRALPPIDLIIALDTTGSMVGEVASLREEIAGLAELLVDLTEGAAVGIIDFKDGCGTTPALRIAPLVPIDRRSVLRLSAFAREMRPGSSACNRTPDEDLAEALQEAVASAWRPGSEYRSIVLISDNPAHMHLRDQAVAEAGRFAARPGARHTVSTVFVDGDDTGTRSYPDTATFLRRVADAGNGQFVRSSQNASLSITILRAIFG